MARPVSPPSFPGDENVSGTSTIPNSPRTETTERPRADMPTYSPLPSPSTASPTIYVSASGSDGQNLDIIRTWNQVINVKNAPARIAWPSDAPPDARSKTMLIDLRLQPERDTMKASLQVHTRVVSPGANTGRRGGGVRVVVYIPAERIDKLCLKPPTAQPPLGLGLDSFALTFAMLQPPALVIPKNFVVEDPVSTATMDMLYSFVAQSTFAIYTEVSERKLSKAMIQRMCTAASARKLISLKENVFTKVPTLYQGRGGQIVEGAFRFRRRKNRKGTAGRGRFCFTPDHFYATTGGINISRSPDILK